MATGKKAKIRLTDEQKLEAALQKVQQLKDAAELKKARLLKNASRGSSADDTRQKILIGAFIKLHFSDMKTFSAGENRFIDFLKRDDDRALFGFAPLPKTNAPAADATAPATPAAPAPAPTPTPAPKAAPAAAPAPDIRTSVAWLNVPMTEKDEAKKLGARWDNEKTKWWAPPGIDVSLFKKWLC